MSLEAASFVLHMAVRSGTPLLLGTVGEIYAERSGVMNLGIEGIMLVGAITGFAVALATGQIWLGFLAASLAGLALALIHAFASITLYANQVVSGLALTMLGTGLSSLMGRGYVEEALPSSMLMLPIRIPGLSDLPVIGIGLFYQDPLAYFALGLAFISWIVLYKTSWGIAIRAVGDDPASADAAGIDVYLVRYACVAFGGAMAGLAGSYLSLVLIHDWIEGMTVGKGWIVVALVVFALWDPLRAIVGAYLFGWTEVLKYQPFMRAIGISPPLLDMLPYVATILAMLVGVSEVIRKKVGAPAALGKPYIREERVI